MEASQEYQDGHIKEEYDLGVSDFAISEEAN